MFGKKKDVVQKKPETAENKIKELEEILMKLSGRVVTLEKMISLKKTKQNKKINKMEIEIKNLSLEMDKKDQKITLLQQQLDLINKNTFKEQIKHSVVEEMNKIIQKNDDNFNSNFLFESNNENQSIDG